MSSTGEVEDEGSYTRMMIRCDVTWRDDAALKSHIETIHTKAELLELEQSQFVHKNKNVITLGIKSN